MATEVGRVADVHGTPLPVSAGPGEVVIAGRSLGLRAAEEFAQLLVRASWLAGQENGAGDG